MMTVHLYNNRRLLFARLEAKPAVNFSPLHMKSEDANGDVHLFRVLSDYDSVSDLLALRADEVIVHGETCSEHLPKAIYFLRPKKVSFEL